MKWVKEEREEEERCEGEKSRSNRPTDAASPAVEGQAQTNDTPGPVTVMSRLIPPGIVRSVPSRSEGKKLQNND